MDDQQNGPKHTTMPLRSQKTPYGDVKLTSRWKRDRYYLMASGSSMAVRWLFPTADQFESRDTGVRHTFIPAPQAITVERELRKTCAKWQSHWDERLQDEPEKGTAAIGNHDSQMLDIHTLGQLFDYLYEFRKPKIAHSTTDRDRYRLKLWRTELGNDCRLIDLRPEMITAALARIGKRTSPCTANTSLGVLKTYLTWAANCGLVPNLSHRTVNRLKEPSGSRHRREWWTLENIALALSCAMADQHQPTALLLVACGCFLGMRPEEVVMQRWQDLDLDAKHPVTGEPRPVCHVVSHSGWMPKDGEERDIPIAAPLHELLLEHRKADGYLLIRERKRKDGPRKGKGWSHRYDTRKVWRRIMKRIVDAGGKRITPYGMRHTFASNLLNLNVKDAKISHWLGHGDTRMLYRHYGHLMSYDEEINAMKVELPKKRAR